MLLNKLKQVNFSLLMILILFSFIPLVYSTIRINFLSDFSESSSFNIASQIVWLNIVYEVLNEAILLPLFYILGKVFSDKHKLNERITFSLILYILIHLFISLNVYFNIDIIIKGMSQVEHLHILTVEYIKLEAIGIALFSVFSYSNIVLNNKKLLLFLLILIKTLLIIFFDFIFVSQFDYSLKFGILGIAYTNILVNLILSILSIYFLLLTGFKFKSLIKMDFMWLKKWFSISIKSGLESFIRNTAFVLMILKLVNEVELSGIFWLTNQFIWSWLLLPILPLGELIKQDVSRNYKVIDKRFNIYFLISGFIVLIWVLSIPFWEYFISNLMGVKEFSVVIDLVLLMLPFYILFVFNNVMDSYFYGIGRTDFLLKQSILVNTFYYGGAYFLYLNNLFHPNINSICLLFGYGLVFDFLITTIMYIKFKKYNLFN